MSPTEPDLLADIRDTPLSVDEVLAAVRADDAGAVALFVGQVRDHDEGRRVTALGYSCHPSAGQVAERLARSYAARAGILRVAVLHRVGQLTIGDLAIVAAVSAAHRGEAFAACREFVDDYKSGVPIWKHQVFSDGTDEWVGLP